jgi:hypothetical protein
MRYLKSSKRRHTLKILLIWALLMVPASALLYGTSAHVRELENDLASIQSNVAREQDTMRVLRAEWAYLNDPQKLAQRAKKYLGTKEASASLQVARMDQLTTKISYRTPETNAARLQTASLSTRVLAKSIVYHEQMLSALRDNSPARLPASAGWTQKMVSTFGFGTSPSAVLSPTP